MSFKPTVEIFQIPPQWLFKPTLEHWVQVLSETGDFARSFANSVIVASSVTAISIVLGSFTAYALLRLKTSTSNGIANWALSNRVAPPIVSVVALYFIFMQLRLLDTQIALIVSYLIFDMPYALWMMREYIASVPIEIEESAMLDGCSQLGAFRRMVLPAASYGLVVTAIFCFIFAWNEFLFSFMLTQHDAVTLPRLTMLFITHRGVRWGEVSTLAMVTTLPVLALSILIHRYLVGGLTLGAVKG